MKLMPVLKIGKKTSTLFNCYNIITTKEEDIIFVFLSTMQAHDYGTSQAID